MIQLVVAILTALLAPAARETPVDPWPATTPTRCSTIVTQTITDLGGSDRPVYIVTEPAMDAYATRHRMPPYPQFVAYVTHAIRIDCTRIGWATDQQTRFLAAHELAHTWPWTKTEGMADCVAQADHTRTYGTRPALDYGSHGGCPTDRDYQTALSILG